MFCISLTLLLRRDKIRTITRNSQKKSRITAAVEKKHCFSRPLASEEQSPCKRNDGYGKCHSKQLHSPSYSRKIEQEQCKRQHPCYRRIDIWQLQRRCRQRLNKFHPAAQCADGSIQQPCNNIAQNSERRDKPQQHCKRHYDKSKRHDYDIGN